MQSHIIKVTILQFKKQMSRHDVTKETKVETRKNLKIMCKKKNDNFFVTSTFKL